MGKNNYRAGQTSTIVIKRPVAFHQNQVFCSTMKSTTACIIFIVVCLVAVDAGWHPCNDRYKSCPKWIANIPHRCYGGLDYYYNFCAGACKRCVNEDVESPITKRGCPIWKAEGLCKLNKAIQRICKFTCSHGELHATTPTTPPTPVSTWA